MIAGTLPRDLPQLRRCRLRALREGLAPWSLALQVAVVTLAVLAALGGPLPALTAAGLLAVVLAPAIRRTVSGAHRELLRRELSAVGPAPRQVAGSPDRERDELRVDLGYELARWRRELLHDGDAALFTDRHGRDGRQRVLELLAALHRPGEVALAVVGLRDPEQSGRSQAYLRSLAADACERRVVDALDECRPLRERVRDLDVARQALGELPRRQHPRMIWTAPATI